MINHEVDGTDKSDRWRPVDLNLLRFVGHRDGSDATTIDGVPVVSLNCIDYCFYLYHFILVENTLLV